jgi:hypothetical protein
MASTYSTSLKLTLIGDGDQSGIWGQTTNTNLGTLLEQAITGVQSIVMADANYTLTNFNGVLDEARNAVLVVTGTNNAVRDLIPPVVEKLYVIYNNTTGGYAIRIIGVSGTGVNIPNGATAIVYCDGTNFILANTPSTNGIVAVAQGGTGQTTLTANNVVLGNGSAAVQFVAPGSSGNVLVSNGTTWVSGASTPEFASGTRMTFNQTNAPTGWTKDTGTDNAGFRLVNGSVSSGGSLDFTNAFSAATAITVSSISGSAGATTLSTPQIPSHTHTISNDAVPFNFQIAGSSGTLNPGPNPAGSTDATGGGGSHTHPFSFSSGSGAVNLAVKYVDLIIAQKN